MATVLTLKDKIGFTLFPFISGDPFDKIYLYDIGRRSSLGGTLGIYKLGQDQYICAGETITLQDTGEVTLSTDRGVIKKLIDLGLLSFNLFTNYNSMLLKFDADTGIVDIDFDLGTLNTGTSGLLLADFISAFEALLVKLDNDIGVNDIDYFSILGGITTFTELFTNFNLLLVKLDADVGVTDINYASTLIAT